MATQRGYIGSDADLDYFERLFQSANINFLIGSGASQPAISMLGNIENKLQQYIENENEANYFEEAERFLDDIWDTTNVLLNRSRSNQPHLEELKIKVQTAKNNYKNFINSLEKILTKRRSGLLPRRANIFTTNYDLFIEDAATNNQSLILNDGFTHRKNIYNNFTFDSKSFYRSVYATGNLYSYSVELPTINLIKLHGSLSWWKYEEDIYYCIPAIKPLDLDDNLKKDWVNNHALVLPRKEKFKETVLENIYYDLLRTYSNELDKEGTLLAVFGFSFADEHIELLTKKALKNTTLKMLLFAYSESSVVTFSEKFRDFSNVEIIYIPNGNLDFEKFNSIITKYLGKNND